MTPGGIVGTTLIQKEAKNDSLVKTRFEEVPAI